jgi:hypothetical protein
MGALNGSIWLKIGTGTDFFEYGDEPSDSIKCGVFLE